MHEMCERALRGDRAGAEAVDERLRALHKNLFIESNPIPSKWLLHDMGLIPPGIRLPLTSLSAEYHDVVRAALREAEGAFAGRGLSGSHDPQEPSRRGGARGGGTRRRRVHVRRPDRTSRSAPLRGHPVSAGREPGIPRDSARSLACGRSGGVSDSGRRPVSRAARVDTVLPDVPDMRVERDGGLQRLVVAVPPRRPLAEPARLLACAGLPARGR